MLRSALQLVLRAVLLVVVCVVADEVLRGGTTCCPLHLVPPKVGLTSAPADLSNMGAAGPVAEAGMVLNLMWRCCAEHFRPQAPGIQVGAAFQDQTAGLVTRVLKIRPLKAYPWHRNQ